MNYAKFLDSKRINDAPSGHNVRLEYLNSRMFDWQKVLVQWALKRGRAALFWDCGLGKTFAQLEWATHIKGRVIILTPLAVALQTEQEAAKFGIPAFYCKDQAHADECRAPIVITNYEKLHKFDVRQYKGVVLDESSILKCYTGRMRNEIISAFSNTPYRLACTATPAPNDYMELGNHAEFLGVLTRTEMLATFFIHDGGETSKWRLKGHASKAFWQWMGNWACMLRTPADLGYDASGYVLPKLEIHRHVLDSENWNREYLFPMPAKTLQDQRKAKRVSIEDRCNHTIELVGKSKEPWIVWCELNDEGDYLEKHLPEAEQIAGKHNDEIKEDRLRRFASGELKRLVTKGSIAGFGMNWQHCAKSSIVNLSHSYEQFYQMIRRIWRYGQERLVDVHLTLMDTEVEILANIDRKQSEADQMAVEMSAILAESIKGQVEGTRRQAIEYTPEERMMIPPWLQ